MLSELQLFSQHILTTGGSKDTERTYVSAVRIFDRWCMAQDVNPPEARRADVERFIADQVKTLAANTARNRLLALRAYFAWHIDLGHRKDNPTTGLKVKKPRNMPKQPVTMRDMRRLVYGARTGRDHAMILIMAATGVRIGELCKMRVENIDWEQGRVLIDGKGSKQRLVAPGAEGMEALRMVVAGRRRGPIWLTKDGEPMTRDRARQNFYRLTVRLGLRVHPHQLRATFANIFLEEGGDLGALQSAMGHSDIATTSHYAGATRQARGLNFMAELNIAGRIL